MADRCRLSLLEEAPLIVPPALTAVDYRDLSTPAGFGDIRDMVTLSGLQMLVVATATRVFTTDDYGATYSEKQTDLGTAGYSGQTYAVGKSDSNFLIGDYSQVAISNALGNGWTYTSLNTLWGGNFFIRGVAWNGSVWIVVADSGKVATSANGTSWTDRTAALSGAGWGATGINDVIWDGTNFVIVGDGTNAAISANGSSWSVYSTGTALNAVAWTGTNLLAVGANGLLRRSADGTSWSTLTSLSSSSWGSSNDCFAIGSWAGRTVVVGQGNNIAHSDDEGTSWTVQSLSTLGSPETAGVELYGLDYDNNKLTICGQVGSYIYEV